MIKIGVNKTVYKHKPFINSGPKYIFNLTRAFSLFDADLQIMPIWNLKLNLVSIINPSHFNIWDDFMLALSIVCIQILIKLLAICQG